MSNKPPWGNCFVDPDDETQPAVVRVRQIDRKSFLLESSMRFIGPAGVDGLPDEARTLRPEDLGPEPITDLASVPSALRWFIGTYGVHTPAALVHDRLIGDTALPGVSDTDADRFFRFMLKAVGVRFIRRWMMWTAVAFGTRWRAGGIRRVTLLIWVVCAAAGMTAAYRGVVSGNWWLMLAAVVAPFVAALLWDRQYGAGLTAALSAIWVLPPTILGAVGFGFYWLLEHGLAFVLPPKQAGDEPATYENF
ncbi:MAG: DUF1353 domain-containing protein [Nocardioidaceae bacterium]